VVDQPPKRYWGDRLDGETMRPDKAALGTRYVCFSCEVKFYDLNREEPTCPGCGADQRDNPEPDPITLLLQKKRRRRKKAPEPEPEPVVEKKSEQPDNSGFDDPEAEQEEEDE